tara:strand:- start:215 stop:613 length:399 start_codon:yes stop_codon:yes gene_type:complete
LPSPHSSSPPLAADEITASRTLYTNVTDAYYSATDATDATDTDAIDANCGITAALSNAVHRIAAGASKLFSSAASAYRVITATPSRCKRIFFIRFRCHEIESNAVHGIAAGASKLFSSAVSAYRGIRATPSR